MNLKNEKHKNHRKSDFHKVLTHVGAGKSAFFYEKVGKSIKITKFMGILENFFKGLLGLQNRGSPLHNNNFLGSLSSKSVYNFNFINFY